MCTACSRAHCHNAQYTCVVIVSAQVQSQVNCYRINSNSKAPGVDGVMAEHVLYSHKCTKHQFIHLLTATFKDLHIENSKNYKR